MILGYVLLYSEVYLVLYGVVHAQYAFLNDSSVLYGVIL